MKHKSSIAKKVYITCYIICILVLIAESLMPGNLSAKQSNSVGSGLADFINGYKDDQTVVVKAKKVEITNKISEIYVGDSYMLETLVTPIDATYKSLKFASSDLEIASVSDEGNISFLKEGSVEISISSTKYSDLKDSMTVNVKNVLLESIDSSIDADINDGVYNLLLGSEYYITNVFNPTNTTCKDVSYEISSNNYLKIENGVITPLKNSFGDIIVIKVISGDKYKILRVCVTQNNVVELESISFTTNTIYVNQEMKVNVSFNPTNATFKDYILESSDPSIIKINGKKIVGVKDGKAMIKASSSIYPNIYFEKEIEVLPSPNADLDKTTVSLTNELSVGKKAKIIIKKYPVYALDVTAEYRSGDESIATVTNTGEVTGISVGETSINVKINNDKTFTLPISIFGVSDVTTTDFTLSTDKLIVYCNEKYNLNELVSGWIPDKPLNTEMIYSLSDSSIDINGSILKIGKPGEYILDVTHKASGICKQVLVKACYRFSVENISGSLNSIVGSEYIFKINDESNGSQNYNVNISNSAFTINKNSDGYRILAIDSGVCEVVISPMIDGEIYEQYQKSFTISASHYYTQSMDYQVLLNDEEIVVKDDTIKAYISDKCLISLEIDESTTIYKIIYLTSNSDIVSIDGNGKLIFNGIGDAKITITEEYSNISKEINISVRNYVDFKEDVYTIRGENILFENNVFKIKNGKSAKISFNFKEGVTYKIVRYSSSNTKIAEVGSDGIVTPKKAGSVKIYCVIDDGVSDEIRFEIEFKVLRQNFIEKNDDFFYKVRKSLGHFGAFCILGIFSSISWYLIFNKKKLYFSIPINFALGFIIAATTEIIQFFIPGRYGVLDDALLDFDGFMVSSILLSLIFIGIYLKKKYSKL